MAISSPYHIAARALRAFTGGSESKEISASKITIPARASRDMGPGQPGISDEAQ